MIKFFKIISLVFLLFSCSLNSDSKFWSKRNIGSKQKILNIKQISKKDEILLSEINKSSKINLSSLKKENFSQSYFYNNNGRTNYDGELKSISRYKFKKIERFNEYEPEVILDNQNIIFFDNKGTILKFDQNSKLIWKNNYYTKSEKKLNPFLFMTAKNNILIVVDSIAKTFAINIETGKLIWSNYNISPFNSQIKIFEDKFYVVDTKNILRCFSVIDGKEIWNYKTDAPFIKSQKRVSLIIKNNKVIFNNSIGDITAVDTDTGDLVWQTPTQSKKIYDESMFFKNSDLISTKNSLLFSNNNNDFYSLNSKDGLLNWKQKLNSNVKPVYFNELIFTVTNEGYLAVINNKNGELIRSTYLFNSFKSKKRKNIKPIGFIVGKKNIYLTLNNGRLMVISISNGNVESIIKIDKEKISSPVVQGQNLYITKNNSIIKLN